MDPTVAPHRAALQGVAQPVYQASDPVELLSSFGITRAHLERVAHLGRHPQADPAQLVDAFYRWLDTQPWKQRFFPRGVPARVRSAQVGYWRDFLAGVVDAAYVDSRRSVGATHAHIDLPPQAYTTAMAFSQHWLTDVVRHLAMEGDVMFDTAAAVSLLCQLDVSLVMEAYGEHSYRRLQEQAEKVHAINHEVTRVVVAASEGNFHERYEPRGAEDTRLAEAVNQMVEGLRRTIWQAKAIAAGDYSADVAPRSSTDELGRVLSEMTQRLREATERTQRDQWLRQGHADVFERMRGELSTQELARSVIAYTAKRIGAAAGSVYVLDDSEDLRLAATFGCTPDGLRPVVRLGEGVLGEVAQDRTPVFALDVSEHPIVGFHGLGEIVLTNVTLLPVATDERLQGVLQFASQKPPSDLSREFLLLVAENVAIGLGGSMARVRMRKLLERSQRQGEELQAQAEELRASNEELQERSDALTRTRAELEAKNLNLEQHQAAIEATRAELEKRAAELALASKYKSEFLANMSHEFRTPLNSMLLLCAGLAENPDGNLTEKQLASVRIIRSGGEDLLRLIRDILDLSKVEAGKLSIEVGRIALDGLLDSLRRQFLPVAADKGLSLYTHLDPDAPAVVESDDLRVQQVLKNLLSNAFKFTDRGSVTLRIASAAGDSRIRSSALAAGAAVAISVADTGIGIPRDKQRAIFEAFQQADGSTSRTHGGTGLGLTISRELCGLLGGEIHLSSEEGQGCNVTVFLPVTYPGQPQAPEAPGQTAAGPRVQASHTRLAAAGAGQDGRKAPGLPVAQGPQALPAQLASAFERFEALWNKPVQRILVVEDHAGSREAIRSLVGGKGTSIEAVGTGREGLAALARETFDCIVVDLGLPDMDGLAFLKALQADHPPVIVYTGRDLSDTQLAELERHTHRIVVKGASSTERLLDEVNLFLRPTETQRQDGRQAVLEPVHPAKAKLEGRKVLVVDDDMRNVFALTDLLQRNGLSVIQAKNGQVALDRLAAEPDIALVIMDIMMPVMDGHEAMRRIRAQPRFARLPIIALTAKTLPEDRTACLLSGASDYLTKPMDPENLLALIRVLLFDGNDEEGEPSQRHAV